MLGKFQGLSKASQGDQGKIREFHEQMSLVTLIEVHGVFCVVSRMAFHVYDNY